MLWKVLVVGSVSWGPSTRFRTNGLVKFVEHRIADRRVVRLIQKWLNAGVLEDGKRIRVKKKGRPRAAALRRCWPTFISITCSTCGSKRGVRSGRTADAHVIRFANDIVVDSI